MTERRKERVFAPTYLWAFFCDGSSCESRCCRGWQIPVDASARERFATLPLEMREKIFADLTEKETGWETRHSENSDCAFLDGDGLCRLQKRLGESFLPDICDSYPRVSYRFSDFVERSLALTCPVAARLALLSKSPMLFEERMLPARRASSAIRPPMEALRWEPIMRSLQRRMIALLQDRTRPLRHRFLHLGKFLEELESYREPPTDARLAVCLRRADVDGEPVRRAAAFFRLRYMAELFVALYGYEKEGHGVPAADALASALAEHEAYNEACLYERYGHILENLAVHELFLRLYPFACAGGFLMNFKLFVLRFRVVEFSLLLAVAAKSSAPDEVDLLLMLDGVMEKLDHNRAAGEFLKRRAAEDFQGIGADEFLSRI